jgi:hypothetical protein
MRMRSRLAVAFAFVLTGAVHAGAGPMTAADLDTDCSALDMTRNSTCRSYVLGVVEGLRLAARTLGERTQFCVPSDVPEGQLVAIFEEAVREHPQDLKKPAAALVASAVAHTFPCAKPDRITNSKTQPSS